MPLSPSQRLAPLFLRVALGLTFLWAGFGKVSAKDPVSGHDAAILANMGVQVTPESRSRARPAPTEPESPRSEAAPASRTVLVSFQNGTYSASDFPESTPVRRVYGIAIMLHKYAHPPAKADGKPGMLLWPRVVGGGAWPVYFAWAVVVAEIAGGLFVLAGFLTRVGAVAIMGTMLGAIWLAEIGPAIQSGNTWLMVLPDHPPFDGPGGAKGSYVGLLWQVMLLAGAASVLLLGPGALAIDGLLFGKAPAGPPRPAPKPPGAT